LKKGDKKMIRTFADAIVVSGGLLAQSQATVTAYPVLTHETAASGIIHIDLSKIHLAYAGRKEQPS
jgi:hypothetical protein